MNKDKFSIEYESIEDYIKARTVVEEGSAGGGGGGGGGTFIHSELEGLDYESSGHTGFASTEDLYEQTQVFASMVEESEESVLGVIGEPEEGTVSADIASLKASVSAVEDKLQEVLNKFIPQPDAPDPEVPSYIPEYYELATDEDFSGTANGSFKYIGTKEYVIIPYRIKGVVVRSYKEMFKNKPVKGVASYSREVLDYSNCFEQAGITGQPLELKYLETGGAYVFSNMFKGCKAGTLDLSGWDTSNVYLMDYLFYQSLATSINVSGWSTKKVSTFFYCFAQTAVKSIIGLGDWTNENCKNYTEMFYNCPVLVLDLSGFTTPLVGSFNSMLNSTSSVLEAYAKTQEDANWFNSASLGKPTSYTFTVKGA